MAETIPVTEGDREAAGCDPSRVRAWLVGMTKQGEDRIWRGAQEALQYLDSLEAEMARRERNEHRNCINWGPCSLHDQPMGEGGAR